MYSLWFHYHPEMLCPALCNPMDCSLPGSCVHGISQARILEEVAMPSSRGSFWPKDQSCISKVSCIGRQPVHHYHHLGSPLAICTWKWKLLSHVGLFVTPWAIHTVHGILQARILEWVAFPFSRGSPQPRDQTQVSPIKGRFFTSWATREVQEYRSG